MGQKVQEIAERRTSWTHGTSSCPPDQRQLPDFLHDRWCQLQPHTSSSWRQDLAKGGVAWQIALQETLQESGGQQSLLDECLWHFKSPGGRLRGLVTTHVDDLAIASGESFLSEQQK